MTLKQKYYVKRILVDKNWLDDIPCSLWSNLDHKIHNLTNQFLEQNTFTQRGMQHILNGTLLFSQSHCQAIKITRMSTNIYAWKLRTCIQRKHDSHSQWSSIQVVQQDHSHPTKVQLSKASYKLFHCEDVLWHSKQPNSQWDLLKEIYMKENSKTNQT